MKDYQKRVVEECDELNDKIGRLVGFIGTGAYNALGAAERERMKSQLSLMRCYSMVLNERIDCFKKDGTDFVCDSKGCTAPCYFQCDSTDSFTVEYMKCIFGNRKCNWKRVEGSDERL